MRKILFRGKANSEIREGEWVHGSLLAESPSTFPIIARDYDNDEDWISVIEWDTVDPETVGQFTGLTDKNGKKIFEGDIVKYGDTVHEVVFEQRNGTAYFGLVYSPLETLPFGHYQDLRQIEVIGNIHDNPELLESEDTE